MVIVFALCAALGYGISDFAGGVASRRCRPVTVLLYAALAGLSVLVVVLPWWGAALTPSAAVLAAVGGLSGLVGFALMYRLMAGSPLSVVAPVTAIFAAGMPLVFGVAAGERPSAYAWFGVAVGLAAVAMIKSRGRAAPRARVGGRVVLLACASGAGFGGYFVLIADAGRTGGVPALVVARLTALLVLLAVTFARSGRRREGARGGFPAVLAGACDAAADVLFLVATRHGLLSIAGTVSALYPLVTVLLAITVLRERVGWRPATGLGLSVVSLALVAH